MDHNPLSQTINGNESNFCSTDAIQHIFINYSNKLLKPHVVNFTIPPKLTADQYVDLYIWIGFALPMLFAAAFGNGLTLMVIIRDRWWKSGIQILIASLALADLFSSFLVRPQLALNIVLGQSYPWTVRSVCRLAGYLSISISYVTPLHCCMIAINRLFAIVLNKSNGKKVTSQRAGIVMAAVSWGLPFGLYVVPLAEVDGYFSINRPYGQCAWAGFASSKAFKYSVSFSTTYIPMGIILACYLTIFVHLRLHDRAVVGPPPGRDMLRRKRRWQVAKMMMVTFGVFVISYIPVSSFFYLAKDFYASPLPSVLAWLLLVLWSASFWNPVIYFAMNSDFRLGYIEILHTCTCARCDRRREEIWSLSTSKHGVYCIASRQNTITDTPLANAT